MAGFDAPYVPGWDCHGLPIEIKVDEQLGRKKLEMDPVAVRRACREYAQKYVDLQRTQFERIGVFGRWDNPYLTMSFGYEASHRRDLLRLLRKGLRLQRPQARLLVHPRPHRARRSRSRVRAAHLPQRLRPLQTHQRPRDDRRRASPAKQVYTIIWTTTPWTLPASQAVAFNPEMEYVALDTRDGTYIVAEALLSSVIVSCNLMSGKNTAEPASQADVIARFPGSALERTTFQHPSSTARILGVTADYVTADQGTGAVHTAPAHGVDDFATGKRYDLPEIQYVDNAGRQRNTGSFGGGDEPQPYEDLTVFKSNPVIIELLKEKGASSAPPPSSTPTRTAGAATTPSSSAPPSSGSSAWKPP